MGFTRFFGPRLNTRNKKLFEKFRIFIDSSSVNDLSVQQEESDKLICRYTVNSLSYT